MFDCEYDGRCLNSDKCMRCTNYSLLQLPEDKARLNKQARAKIDTKKKDNLSNCSESWKDLEQAVASRISGIPTTKQYNEMRDARRQVRSGAVWFMPGDVSDTIILVECKERSTVTAKGEKSITIPKSWLNKLEQEALSENKYPAFVFRYKNDEQIYVINKFEVLEEMVLEIKYLRIENERLKAENNALKAEIKRLRKNK